MDTERKYTREKWVSIINPGHTTAKGGNNTVTERNHTSIKRVSIAGDLGPGHGTEAEQEEGARITGENPGGIRPEDIPLASGADLAADPPGLGTGNNGSGEKRQYTKTKTEPIGG